MNRLVTRKLKLGTMWVLGMTFLAVYVKVSLYYHALEFHPRMLDSPPPVHPLLGKVNDSKLVLIFTSLWGVEDKMHLDFQKSGNISKCPYKCEYINDRSRLDEADAVLFHGLSLDLLRVNATLFSPRPPSTWDQIWIFKLNESPLSRPDPGLLPYENMFNWTMTYRRDSDVYAQNGEFMLRGHARRPFKFLPLKLDDESLAKKKLIAGMISNCDPNSQRLQYISLMKNYTEVDIYGRCGPLKCDRKKNCYRLFGEQYKFFLAFENSFCVDYVTEKAFQPLRYGMVPIVRGGGDYSQIFPRGSYINTQNFSSVRELVNYLKFLDSNHDEYRKYFEFRDVYEINGDQICEMCTKIHQSNVELNKKSYPNIYDWLSYKLHWERALYNSRSSIGINYYKFLLLYFSVSSSYKICVFLSKIHFF